MLRLVFYQYTCTIHTYPVQKHQMFIFFLSIVCRATESDIAFLLDASTSIGQTAFNTQLSFVEGFVNGLTIGREKARVAVATFSDEANLQFGFSDHYEAQDVSDAIIKIPYATGLTYTNLGLKLVEERILSESRDNVPKVLVVITDGLSREPVKTLEQAKRLKDEGVTIVCIGN